VFKSENHLHELIADWQTRLSIPIHCFLFKSNIFKDTRIIFNEGLPNHVDWECWMNVFKLNPEVKYTPLKLAVYRIQPHGKSADKEQMKKGYLQAIDIQKGKFGKTQWNTGF